MHLFDPNSSTPNQRAPGFEGYEHLKKAQKADAHIKANIRRLRVVSRVVAFSISVAVLVPITMTLVKFLSTRDIYRSVTTSTGEKMSRTAWAKDTKSWPTWMYFSVAAVSMLLNFGTVFSYLFGVDEANRASHVTSVFGWIITAGNLVVWSVAAGTYRSEKDKHGKSNDLWGWTCSAPARTIQKEFAGEVDFNRYCTVQSASFYIGLAQVGASLLTAVTYVMVFMRNRSKKNFQRQLRLSGFEPSRR
ncbi:uncharacterized protein K460DRAFT_342716 [Cucurbitaria berberidis CBS 394.84]|uniref:MARVEL domain-containing protein n=1 Tax=Cucurbitaria berberidis CBS 394.84 TaxID=1168544 RepID=A0A9P4GDJ5_9PLEO|nr:uncharacterized protein K460DRAFT_342716 [Cucurbitaria berberidis CBS 394.84]KAF1843943.1 hypothetical protein K460DRAFT_342716 [Cucurbitaria berberidis CBS 394.84]